MLRRRALLSSSYIEEDFEFNYNPNYLTIGAIQNGLQVSFGRDSYYSIDGSDEWVLLLANTQTPSIDKGHCISFKSNYVNYETEEDISTFTISKRCYLLGNCMSIIYNDDAHNNNEVPFGGLAYLFINCSNIISVTEDFLPATVLNTSCYFAMFSGCSRLKNSPILPATVLANNCYASMFNSCKSLKNAPELPATELAYSCYQNMFCGSGLKSTPELPAKSTVLSCYYGMFKDCLSLEEASNLNLSADSITKNSYTDMFAGCSKLTIAPKITATYVGDSGCAGMFEGCTSLVTPPDLQSIKSIGTSSFSTMFKGCTSLKTAPSLPTDLWHNCYYHMFEGCTSLIEAPELPSKSLIYGCYHGMFKGCSNLRLIKMMIESDSTDLYDYIYEMYSGTPTGVLVVSDTATWYIDSKYFSGWKIYKLSEYEEALSSNDYLYIEAIDDGVSFKFDNDLEYSIDNLISWNTLTTGTYSPSINTGDKIYIRSKAVKLPKEGYSITGIGTFKFYDNSKRFNVGGKVTSLIWNTGGIHSIPDYLSASLFSECNGLISAENLIFPEDLYVGNNSCYAMFRDCHNLITAPKLNSTHISDLSYQSMFNRCTSLINVFKLPATVLKYGCYSSMFWGCSALVKAPELPAVTLVSDGYFGSHNCYSNMFYECSSLKYIKAMFITDPSTADYTRDWVAGVATTGTFVKNSEATWDVVGNNGVPEGWTIEYADA